MPTIAEHYEQLITEIDGTLSLARGLWLDARDDRERSGAMKRINEMLDQRIEAMRRRDAARTAKI